jgi:AraC-like DNA-binding protein
MLKTEGADARQFEHVRYHPSPDLEPYVEHFWVVRWDLRGAAPYRAETLPHPSVHLTFDQQQGARLGGVTRGKFVTILADEGGVFGTKFRPGGFFPFYRRPLASLTDKTTALRSLWGSRGTGLGQAVLEETDLDRRVGMVEDFLRSLPPEPDKDAAFSTRIVDAIAADRGILRMEDVALRFDVNSRKLQRLFARYVGVSPKWVIQRYRLHEAAEQLERGSASQSALAMELGYADQAHFAKDFKTMVGTSPGRYAKRAKTSR